MARKTKATKKEIPSDVLRLFGFYLSNGEFLGELTYSLDMIICTFPTAQIRTNNVYLA